MAVSYVDPSTGVRFTKIPTKTQGIAISNILTQSNLKGRTTVEYLNSNDFFFLNSAIDIDWNGVIIDSANVTISKTAELIQFLSTVYSKFDGLLTREIADGLYAKNSELIEVQQSIELINAALEYKANKSEIPTHLSQLIGFDDIASKEYVAYKVATGAKSAYDIYVDHGGTLTEEEWLESLHGKSAYEIAKETGTTDAPTEYDWIISLQGEDGYSAYEIAKQHGYIGTESEWLQSLHGATGIQGKSAYEVAVAEGYTGTESEWLLTLQGATGVQGPTGPKGDAAEAIRILGTFDTVEELFEETQHDFNIPGDAYLVGPDLYIYNTKSEEDPQIPKWKEAGRLEGPTGPQGIQGVTGVQGPEGKSSYELYKEREEAAGRIPLSEDEWIASLGTYTAGSNIELIDRVISVRFNNTWRIIE